MLPDVKEGKNKRNDLQGRDAAFLLRCCCCTNRRGGQGVDLLLIWRGAGEVSGETERVELKGRQKSEKLSLSAF